MVETLKFLISIGQLAALGGLMLMFFKGGKALGAIETTLRMHCNRLEELDRAKQDKVLCDERHKGD